MKRALWTWGRVLGPGAVLAILVWRLGTGPFLDGIRAIDPWTLLSATGIAVLTTLCCAWRWKIVARGLGIHLPLRAAVAAYYRSLFLNVTLPGGVVGDVHRGVSHGREVGDLGRALRAVAFERFAGQLVQVIVTVVVLLALPSPVQSFMPALTIVGVVALAGVALTARAGVNRARWVRMRNAAFDDGALRPRACVEIAVASALIVAGHAITFLIAARTAGTTAPIAQLLPLAMLAMMAMVLPSVGGWGPREGVTAWAFGAAGLGAQHGVATGVVYGAMVLVASLPGAVVLGVGWFRGSRLAGRTRPSFREGPVHA